MALDPDKSLLGRVTQSIPEFLSIAHAIDNDFHLRPSLLRRADAHSAAMEALSMPANPITVSLRSDAAEAPTTRSDCRKRSVPENLTPEAFLHS
jgi:hypothetical protein